MDSYFRTSICITSTFQYIGIRLLKYRKFYWLYISTSMLLAFFLRMSIIHLVLSFSDSEKLIPKIIFHIIYYRLLRLVLLCYSVTNRDENWYYNYYLICGILKLQYFLVWNLFNLQMRFYIFSLFVNWSLYIFVL